MVATEANRTLAPVPSWCDGRHEMDDVPREATAEQPNDAQGANPRSRSDEVATAVAAPIPTGLTPGQAAAKRVLDVVVAVTALVLTGWLILLGAAAAAIAHGGSGFYVQRRVGRSCMTFPLLKLKTMRDGTGFETTVTTADDPRITSVGRLLRRTKVDELPQYTNFLLGHRSIVGLRPDVPGFADRLTGADRIILSVAPDITGPATLAYRREEDMLAAQAYPERYNREVIYPGKVRLNRAYVEDYTLWRDIEYLWRTLVGR